MQFSRWAALWIAGLASAGCSGPPATTVLDQLATGAYVSHVLPPINSGCGRFQPGFDPGDPDADPFVPPTVPGSDRACAADVDCDGDVSEICREGRCRAVYDVLGDAFCSVSWTYRLSTEGETRYWDWWAYVLDMGEPDPALALPEHIQAMLPAAHESAFYCHLRWRVDSASAVGTYPESEVQQVRFVLDEVSHFCSAAYAPGAYCPERDAPEACRTAEGQPIVDTLDVALFRSSDPRVVLELDVDRIDDQGGDVRFQGFAVMPETSGAARPGLPGGFSFFYLPCDEPRPSADGQGPGFCAPCRYASGTNTIERCEWEDVGALPASPALIHPAWIERHPDLYADVHGGT